MPTHFQGPPDQVLALDTFIKLTRATNSLTTRLARCGSLEDLTISQFGVLETLLHLGPLPQGELSSRLLKSEGNLTLVIDNLVKRALVQRDRHPADRRVSLISLTPLGRETIERVFPVHARVITQQFNVLTEEEQITLGRLCRKLGKQEGKIEDGRKNQS